MLVGIAVIIGALCLWELIGGVLMVGWGLIELLRQLLFGSR